MKLKFLFRIPILFLAISIIFTVLLMGYGILYLDFSLPIPVWYNNAAVILDYMNLSSLALYFILLIIESYQNKNTGGIVFSILFAVALGAIFLLPHNLFLHFAFLIVYIYHRRKGSALDIPLSYITSGYFFLNLVPLTFSIIGYFIILYGLVRYLRLLRY